MDRRSLTLLMAGLLLFCVAQVLRGAFLRGLLTLVAAALIVYAARALTHPRR